MHEFAIAEAVIKSAKETAEKNGITQIKKIEIFVGDLQNIEIDILKYSLSVLKTEDLKNTEFDIKVIRSEFLCRRCFSRWDFESAGLSEEEKENIHFLPEVSHSFIKCPCCMSSDFEIKKGRGIYLGDVE